MKARTRRAGPARQQQGGTAKLPVPATAHHPHVRIDPDILAGSPHIDGSIITVHGLWAWHRAGVPIERIIGRYPNLGPARILDALAFAYDNRELIEAELNRRQPDPQGWTTLGSYALVQLELPLYEPPTPPRRIE